MSARTPRPAARILLTDPAGRVLLFRFTAADRRPFWCTPGGALDPGESYEAAARRELIEETGLDLDCGPQVYRRHIEFLTLEGVECVADERYFRVACAGGPIDTSRHTELERAVMREHRWFAPAELAGYPETIYPQDLAEMLGGT